MNLPTKLLNRWKTVFMQNKQHALVLFYNGETKSWKAINKHSDTENFAAATNIYSLEGDAAMHWFPRTESQKHILILFLFRNINFCQFSKSCFYLFWVKKTHFRL